MAEKLEGRAREIVEDTNYAVLSIPRQDGTVQSVVVWAHTDGDDIAVNSAEGRDWPANLRRAGTATLTSMADSWEWVAVTGRLNVDTHDGADEHIDQLAKKYLGQDVYPFRQAAEQRVKFTLTPERVNYVNQG